MIEEIVKQYKYISFDMDGVICEDPPSDKNFGMPGYVDFLNSAKSLYLPKFKIYQIVSGRREKYFNETESWLKNHNVKYEKLILKPTHISKEYTPYFKSIKYICSKSDLFIESSKKQAEIIWRLSNKPVYCVEKGVLFSA